jgi:hypothetical protein
VELPEYAGVVAPFTYTLYDVALVEVVQERFTVLELPFSGVAVTAGHEGAVVKEYTPDCVSPPGPVAATMS